MLLVGCSHDAKRENPLDPALTPAVELRVVAIGTTGTTQLDWSPYQGDTPFAAFRVLRKIQGQEQVDILATITAPGRTTFTDTSLVLGTLYSDQVWVVNAAGFEVESEVQLLNPLYLPPVQIDILTLDAATASAALTWTPYHGPRFKAYQVRRRTQRRRPPPGRHLASANHSQ